MADIKDQTSGVRLWNIPRRLALAILPIFLLLCAPSNPRAAETNQPVSISESSRAIVPSFRVQRYEIMGSSVLQQETVDRVMSDAIGDTVNVMQIRSALLKLQQAFRHRGYNKASVTLPQQPLTNGIVQVRVFEGPASFAPAMPATALPAWNAPAFDVRHFEIHGNTALTSEEIDRILSSAAGQSASLDQLRKAMVQLQSAYRERGLAQASVTLPQQLLTDGTVVVQVNEGSTPEAVGKTEQTVTPRLPATPLPARTFEVGRYDVAGNTLLRQETIDRILGQATGTNVTIQQIQKAVGELQLAYRERGFATVGVGLPQQQLTNATVKVNVTEGRLVDVRVTGNRYFSSNNVMRALPTVQEALIWKDEVVNSRIFQRELDIANQNRDRQIYPAISPGPDPGTSALELRVKDRLPLHGRLEVNNYSTPGTPDWRINASAQYNNLWQREHQLGLSYGFTPEAFKSGSPVDDYFFNRPLIANYGAYFRLPFGSAQSVQERINSSTQFGYDEATHQFHLPPGGSRPDLTFYANASSSDTGVQFGPRRPVGTNNTPEFSLFSQDTGQNISLNNTFGARFNFPASVNERIRWNFSGGMDFKTYQLTSYNTNNFYTYEVTEDDVTGEIIVDQSVISSPQPVRKNSVHYLPLSIGIDVSETDKHGNTFASLNGSYNFTGNSSDFRKLAYSPNAASSFAKINLALNRDQKLPANWSLLLRANGQAATGPLINNEQFALGGLNSVRGYFEGDEYGDAGWFGSMELRTPFINSRVPIGSAFVPAWVRGSVFMDGGQRFLLDNITGLDSSRFLCGGGFGLSANINNHVDMHIAVGWPLLDSGNTRTGDPRVYFSLGGQF